MIELLASVEAQRGIPMPVLLEAVEEALTAAARIELADAQIVVSVDRTTGSPQVFRRLTVVQQIVNPLTEIGPTPGYELGDFWDAPVNAQNFGRLAALTAREVISRRVIEFERDRVFNRYRALEGTLIHALVQRVEPGEHVYALLDRDGNEAVLPRQEYEGPSPAINEWLFVVIDSVRKTARGPAVLLSRASANFVAALLPGWPIIAVAREPGVRTLVAVALGGEIKEPDLSVLPAAERELGEPIVWCEHSDDLATLVSTAITALGGDVPFIVFEHDAVLVAPVDFDLAIISRLTESNVYGVEDVSAARRELEERRFAQSISTHVAEPERDAEQAMSEEQMATLLRFRDELASE